MERKSQQASKSTGQGKDRSKSGTTKKRSKPKGYNDIEGIGRTPPNKEKWAEAFRHKFKRLERRNLPRESYVSFFSENPLQYDKKGKAKFRCSKFSNTWTSLNGLLVVAYRLKLKQDRGVGKVTLKVFGQKCQRCNNKYYEPAAHTPEAIDEILDKLLIKVKEKFYGDEPPKSDEDQRPREDSKMKRDHDESRCEACKYGRCQWSRGVGKRRYDGRELTLDEEEEVSKLKGKKIRWMIRF